MLAVLHLWDVQVGPKVLHRNRWLLGLFATFLELPFLFLLFFIRRGIKNKDQLLCLVHSLIGLLQVVVGNAHVYLESWAKNRLIWNLTVVPNWFHNFTTQKEDRMKSKLPHRHLPAPSRFGAHWWHSPSNPRTASALGKTFSPKPASTPRWGWMQTNGLRDQSLFHGHPWQRLEPQLQSAMPNCPSLPINRLFSWKTHESNWLVFG